MRIKTAMKVKTRIHAPTGRDGLMQVDVTVITSIADPVALLQCLEGPKGCVPAGTVAQIVRSDSGCRDLRASVRIRQVPHGEARAFAGRLRARIRVQAQLWNVQARTWNVAVRARRQAAAVQA